MVSLIPTQTHFTKRLHLSFSATPLGNFPRKILHFQRKFGVLGKNLDGKMDSLKYFEQRVCCNCIKNGFGSETDMNLEAEILAFMEKSEKPNAFPTKKELEKAGRIDLVEAIKNKGGWYSFGWDSEEEQEDSEEEQEDLCKGEGHEEMEFDIEELQRRVEKYQESDNSSGNSSQPAASSSGRSLEPAVEEDGGIEGILNRLENERISSLGIKTRKYGYGAKYSNRDNDGRSYETTATEGRTDHGKNGSLATGNPKKGSSSDSGVQLNNKYTPDMWRTWSMQRAGPQLTEFEAGEIDFDKRPNGGEIECSGDDVFTIAEKNAEAFERWKENSHNDIRTRLQELELELSSTLRSLRSKSHDSSKEALGSSPGELEKLSDAWEFQENEVMNAQSRLRSIRAQLSILEGKMALALIDADKLLEKKQKRIDGARKALQLLRTTRIVWHNSASEVLLTGSFDGWTTQRKMEKSQTGIFSLSLKLYPGVYEIKFIVDGIWKIDPLRPIVNNDGFENNVLIVT